MFRSDSVAIFRKVFLEKYIYYKDNQTDVLI